MDTVTQRMERLKILEEDLEERFVLGSGSGGQKINKTSSCVYLKHRPSGHEISCQESRSREKNREIARERLCDYFEKKALAEALEVARNRARRRYQKRKPSRATKARLRVVKRVRSDRKQSRKRVSE
ncbi:MAG: peptide chain release factor-like protein [Verrucomicrobiales bacterium]|nr:peptide chain release factor-like protein [Verrucomicrobiales bacterium]HQW28818.1 peptide chain release factor-like protein [Verrucomicrobiales bacterium]